MLWLFLIVSTLSWGIAEIFYKKGNVAHEKYSHLKTTCFVGLFMGVYALIILLTQNIDYDPINIILYLPVSLCYIISMTCSYFGVRFIEESISDPIENTAGAIVPVLCAIFMHEKIGGWQIVAIVVIVIGVLGVGFVENSGATSLSKKLGKKLAILAFAMPFCYALLDATGTFLDIFYTDDAATSILRGVTDDTLEHVANCSYEFTFFLISIGIFIFLRIKGVKLFSLDPAPAQATNAGLPTDANGNVVAAVAQTENATATTNQQSQEGVAAAAPALKWYQKVWQQKDKLLAALFETIGQATYIFALSEGKGIAAVILGAGTVIVSLTLSRIMLKEKLTKLQYLFILIILGGIIFLSLVE